MDILQVLAEPRYLLSICIVVLTLWYLTRKQYKNPLPPGPKPWPIIGNLVQLKNYKLPLFKVAMKLREKYGDVVKLQVGPQKLVLIMGKDKIHKAGITLNDKFKFRPVHMFITKYMFDGKGLFFTNGEQNSALRKYALGTMREFGVGKRSLEERIQEEADMLCNVLLKKNGKSGFYLENFKMAASNIISGIVFGDRFDYEDPVFHQLISRIDYFFKEMSVFLPENFIPLLRFLPGSKLKRVYGVFKELQTYVGSQVEEHRTTFDRDNVRDFVDMFLAKEGSGDPVMTEDNVFRVIVELFNAGTDTTATTLIWGIVLMIRYPEVQNKCRAEILKVVGTGRFIKLQDKNNLPYLQAFIDEVQRYSAVAPTTPPRTVLEDTEFEGYTIPKDSTVLFILFSLLNNDVWGDADNFRPERFLDDKGQRKTVNEDYLLPFGLGGRSCIGKHLARMEVFLFFGTLLQRFEFKSPVGAPEPSIERIQTGVTCQPEEFDFCAIPYDS